MEYPATVISTTTQGTRAASIRFSRPDGFSYLPGQYLFITIGRGDQARTKHLTISSSPTEPFLQVTKGLTGHPFSDALSGLREGDTVQLRGPYGKFTFIGEYGRVAFLSGGIGVTPFRSMIRYAADNRIQSDIVMLYSMKDEEAFLFRGEFDTLAKTMPNLRVVPTLTRPGPGWKGHSGRIDSAFIGQEIPDWKERVFFTSGPSVMVDGMVSLLTGMGVPSDNIRKEYFSGF